MSIRFVLSNLIAKAVWTARSMSGANKKMIEALVARKKEEYLKEEFLQQFKMNCHKFYSGVVAGAREALLCGVPALSISLNLKKDESQENDFKDDVSVCLPLINTAIRDVEKGTFPKSCLLNVEFPTSLLSNKGFKLTKQSMWRSTPNWLAVSTSRYPTGHFLANQGGLGLQFAQLGPDASAAGAARRLAT
ncbi:hypothetical protein GmHk_16G046399 [Glycine max]|nr:hypothetical protein GmHk_16G046399 [Glycine max]